MKPVRFVSSVPALVWDPDQHMLIKVVRAIDTEGREWESYQDGPYLQIATPDEPDAIP